VTESPQLVVTSIEGRMLIDSPLDELKEAWQRPLRG